MKKNHRLLVYGTLREGGAANHLMEGCILLRRNISLPGYKMYNTGVYPYIFPADADSNIICDLYEVSETVLKVLDDFEGEEYQRQIDTIFNAFIYVIHSLQHPLEEVPNGDWLKFAQLYKINIFPE